ncbi:Tol-Pal system beta propeller repeat protein TolB [Caulobacter vibrioides]|uniref:Tol-Pal system beta propeller repeat protein TolB n=1 Tax=Caulobacter vibrioides TaxID=155892 RepID=UPI0013DE4218|nr:Tol-Pal system beta propeller repeat protein TolB [Caulobacter vibrioides]
MRLEKMNKETPMRLRALLLMVAALLSGAAFVTPAAAQIEVDINAGAVKPLPIAIPVFSGSTRGAEIAQVITGNLERSGLFQPLNVAGVPDKLADVNVQPRFPDWQSTGAQALINGQVTVGADGGLRVDFRLWDVFSQQQLLGLQFSSTPDNWRRVAHKISDAVYERLTGEKGYFDTRVAFVAESGPKLNRVKRLAIMDQDGANPQYLTDGSYIVMTPRFSSTSQELTYMALRPTGSSIYLLNLETSRQETVGKFPGMVFAPRFSPDGSKVAFSVERNGNSDIYVMDLRSRATTRITTDPAIDTSPSFSPDGTKIVFNSDRGGQAQIYVMNTDGSGVRRISYGGGRYTTPVWSPRGDFIAFTKQTGGEFHIGVMRADGGDERLLTTSYLDEGPTWAPNGRVLMFFREGASGNPRLWTVDITGRILRPAAYSGSASDPAWSPLLD